MRKILLLSSALTLGVLTPALSGGPVVVADEPVVVEERPASSSGLLIPVLLLAAIVVAVASGGDDDTSLVAVSFPSKSPPSPQTLVDRISLRLQLGPDQR